jgi:DNA segregation ATPase FtsK/SpoIIIE, S-DNA-T family
MSQSQSDPLLHKIQEIRAYVWSLLLHGRKNAQQLKAFYKAQLIESQESLRDLLARYPVQNAAGWDAPEWSEWDANTTGEQDLLRIGSMLEQATHLDVPGYAPFIGRSSTVLLLCNETTASSGLALLQSLVIRIACMLPHDARFRLLDPAGFGRAFPMQRYLLEAQIPVEKNGNDIARDLEAVIEDIKSINRTMLTPSITSFEQIPHKERVNWRYQFIFAADFPHEYDERAIRMLQKISVAGPGAGIYLFIQWNQSHAFPRDVTINGFRNAFSVNQAAVVHGLQFRPDGAPAPDLQKRIFTLLKQAKQQEELIEWEPVVGLAEDQWATQSADQFIATPIGLGRGGTRLDIWFGEKDDGQQHAHGVVAGMTGSGKSSLCHVLICGLALRYSPDELQLYLIDGKNGVEFKPYCDLPHAKIVSLHSSAELSRSVLAELVEEMERRNNAFFKPEGVNSLAAYRQKGQRRGKLARVLLIVDEYQELFEGDRDDTAARNLRQLAQMGRNAGIHILLSSQRYIVSVMPYRNDILGNVHVRMMMRMTDADVQTLEDFGARGKLLIQRLCDRRGMVVVKDQVGDDDSAYQPGKVAFLAEAQRTALLKALQKRYRVHTIVFDGDAQPSLLHNPQCRRLLAAQNWLTAQEMEVYAHDALRNGGLADTEWYAAEAPHVTWLGQEFNVHGHVSVIFRHRSSQNLMLLGEANAPRYGMLAALIAGLSSSGNPHTTKFIIMDNALSGTPWSETLLTTCALLPEELFLLGTKNANLLDACFQEAYQELVKRQQLSGEELVNEASIFLVMTELDMLEELRRKDGPYGEGPYGGASKPSLKKDILLRLITEGPEKGIHLILSFTSLRKMNAVLETRHLEHFQYRVGLKMPVNDFLKFGFVQSRNVVELQKAAAEPVCALYINMENSENVLFKAYSLSSAAEEKGHSIMQDIDAIAQLLAKRSTHK